MKKGCEMAEKIIVHELSTDFTTLELYPLSDLHIGSPFTDTVMFQKFIRYILAEPNRFILFNGDNMNNALKSSVSNVYNETMNPREQKKWLIQELSCVKDRILCFVEGNHEYRTTKEVDLSPVEEIADRLGKYELYREDEAILKITFGKNIGKTGSGYGCRIAYSIYVTHGNGGGKRPGSALNNIELLALTTDADIYICGHIHKKMAYKSVIRRIDMHNNTIRAFDRLFAYSAAWQDYGGYAVRKMLPAGSKGSTPIILSGTEKKAEAIV